MKLAVKNSYSKFQFRDDEETLEQAVKTLMTHEGVRFVQQPKFIKAQKVVNSYSPSSPYWLIIDTFNEMVENIDSTIILRKALKSAVAKRNGGDLAFYGGMEYKALSKIFHWKGAKEPEALEFVYKLYSEEFDLFPTGFYFMLKRLLAEYGYTFLAKKDLTPEIEKTGKYCTVTRSIDIPETHKLYEGDLVGAQFVIDYIAKDNKISYEEADRPEAAEALKKVLSRKRGIVQLPVGVGKTGFGAMIAAELGIDFLYLVPNLTLFTQVYKEFIAIFGKDLIGRIGDRYFETDNLITISTPRKLLNALKEQREDALKFVIRQKAIYIDECHHVAPSPQKADGKLVIKGNQWYDVAMRMQHTYYRIAVSGTPEAPSPLAQKFLQGATGDTLFAMSFKEAADAKYIMLPKVLLFDKVPLRETFSEPKNVMKVYKEGILENPTRNELIIKVANYFVKRQKSVLIVVERVEQHSEVLFNMITEMKGQPTTAQLSENLKVEVLTGIDDPEKRHETFEALKRKEVTVLITTLAKEGVNIPSLDVLIMAGGLKSSVAVMQKAGRVVRTHDDKEMPIIVDFVDGQFGKSDSPYLTNHSKQRRRLYEKEQFELTVIPVTTWQDLLDGKDVSLGEKA